MIAGKPDYESGDESKCTDMHQVTAADLGLPIRGPEIQRNTLRKAIELMPRMLQE